MERNKVLIKFNLTCAYQRLVLQITQSLQSSAFPLGLGFSSIVLSQRDFARYVDCELAALLTTVHMHRYILESIIDECFGILREVVITCEQR